MNWNNRISAVCNSRERRGSTRSTSLSREVEAIVKQQLDSFKQAYDEQMQIKMKESSEEAYRKGRKEAEMKDFESWTPSIDPKILEKAKRLEFIDLAEIKAVLARVKGRDKNRDKATFKIDETGTLKVDGDTLPKEREAIKWLEWQALFADLLDYYLIHGGHLEKTGEMLTYYRLLQRLGMEGIFTFESLQEMDHHVRSRPEGQGENLSWRLDGGPTKWLYLREYRPVTSKEKVTPSKGKRKNRSGACFDWLQGKACKFGERSCKFAHACSFCKLSSPRSHILDDCSNKAVFEAAFKKPKHKARE